MLHVVQAFMDLPSYQTLHTENLGHHAEGEQVATEVPVTCLRME